MFNLDNFLIHVFPEHEVPSEVEFGDTTFDPQCNSTLDDLSRRDLCLPSLSSSCQCNDILKCIDKFLLEDDDFEENRAFMGQDSLDLQATEISLYNLLNEKHPHKNQDPLLINRSCDLHLTKELEIDGHSSLQFMRNKNHYRDENDKEFLIGRSNKLSASFGDITDEEPHIFDKMLLCPCLEPSSNCVLLACLLDKKASSGHKSKAVKHKKPCEFLMKDEMVDLTSLLTQCVQAMVKNDTSSAKNLLWQVKQHSSPLGGGIERMAYYAAKALEARLAGSGGVPDASQLIRRLTSSDTLKAYLAFLSTCPFTRMSDFFANNCISKLAENSPSIHIIDFGISNGFQWPRLIQHLSRSQGGPAKLRITGIDFPRPGFRPSERAEETGRFLAYYCKRFNVPFEYDTIAKKWDSIKMEDLQIRNNAVVIVNCLFWLRCVPDDSVKMNSPRDTVLNLIRTINPDLFIHGIVNGSYNAPFFQTRFREVLLNFYAAFDMYDSILPREDEGRLLLEREIAGSTMMNAIAYEGFERVVRPETYKQWQKRNFRAGLEPVPLEADIVNNVSKKVKSGYHKDFVVDVDCDWLLQGWRGRIFTAISCWKPSKKLIISNTET